MGLALNYGIDVKAGVVDRGYRGNVGVILKNDSEIPFQQKCGQPIAQLILEKSDTPPVERVDTLPATERGSRSFGQQTTVTYEATAKAPGKLPESTYH